MVQRLRQMQIRKYTCVWTFSSADFGVTHGNGVAGRALLDANTEEVAGVHDDSRADAGARNRCEYSAVFGDQWSAAESPALSESRTARGSGRRVSAVPGGIDCLPEFLRLGADEPHLRGARCLSSHRFQLDRLRRGATIECGTGLGKLLSVAGRRAGHRTKFLAGGRQARRTTRSHAERTLLEEQVCKFPGNFGEDAEAGRDGLYGDWGPAGELLFLLRVNEFPAWGRVRAHRLR